jgi:hypothetical protein
MQIGEGAETHTGTVRRQLVSGLARLTLGGLASAALSGCVPAVRLNPPAQVPEARLPRIGQTWRYAHIDPFTDTVTTESIARVVAQNALTEILLTDRDGRVLGQERWSDARNLVEDPLLTPPMRFEQPVPMLPPALAPGSAVSAGVYYRITADSRRRWWSARVSASDWERVTVPAGHYQALRIDRQIAFEHPDLFKLYATHSDTLWWVPEVARWVRRDIRATYRDSSDDSPAGDRRTDAWVSLQWLA